MTFRITKPVVLIAVTLVMLAIATAKWREAKFHAKSVRQRDLVERAFSAGQFETTLQLAEPLLDSQPPNISVIQTAAKAAEGIGDFDRAIGILEMLPSDFADAVCHAGWLRQAKLMIRTGRLSEARAVLERMLQHNDQDAAALSELARLLCGVGENSEGGRLWQRLLSIGQINVDGLQALARKGSLRFNKTRLEHYYKINPTDTLVISGMLETAWASRDVADVEWLLQKTESTDWLIVKHRERLALSRGEFFALQPLPHKDDALRRSEWLLLQAQQFRQQGKPSLVTEVLRQSLIEAPWETEAAFLMTEILREQRDSQAEKFQKLVSTLQKIESLSAVAAVEINDNDAQNSFDACQRLTEQLSSLGRTEEAAAWSRLVLRQSRVLWAARVVADSLASAKPQSQYVHPVTELPVLSIDMSANHMMVDASVPISSEFVFVDVSESVGLDFDYQNGVLDGQEGLKMHQWTGGGVAVFDLDHDEWPDLYLTQGGNLSPDNLHLDEVFRNVRGQKFAEVASKSRVAENGFGQGVAAGDVNSDGFADIYVANVGRNCLLINQGDGTFVPHEVAENCWTTSVAIADVTGDGLPDLYDVNYLKGSNVFTLTCDHDGEQRICGPTDFDAEADILHRLKRNGDFVDVTVPDKQENGRGMGLIVGGLTGASQNVVYVANDESANRLLQFDAEGIVVADDGFLAGVSFGDTGEAQGSMGIAVGDADNNGRSDLFVTNYYSESNNLFRQVQPGIYIEASRASGLAAPGFAMLGFGCQFLDANSDGDLELMVANGHLDDFTHQGKPFRMRPQLFANSGGRFREADPSGNYFSQQLLGRAVATLDWNKDGRQDFAVTHLDHYSSLVENRSPQKRNSLSVRLVGVESSRNAVGAEMRQVSNSKVAAWLTAGSGYQASNERSIVLVPSGEDLLGSAWEITWPNGQSHSVSVPIREADVSFWAIVEGRSRAYEVPR